VVVTDCDEEMIVHCFEASPEAARPACCLAALSAGEVRAMLDTEVRVYLSVCLCVCLASLSAVGEGLQTVYLPHTYLSLQIVFHPHTYFS
jgi:hypothetical protein